MAEDEKQDELELIPPEEQEQEAGEKQEASEEPTYEEIGENRYRWSDGLVTDGEGNEIEEEAEKKPEPKQEPKPELVVPAVTPPQRQIYTVEATEKAVYSDEALQAIADKSLEDPLEAERMRVRLKQEYDRRVDSLRQYSSSVFDQDLEELAKVAPKTIERFGRQIERMKAQATPEQLQTPGSARMAVAWIMAQKFAEDPLIMEESFMRSIPPGGTSVKPPAPAPAPRRVIPREERLPGPGTARKPEPQRRRTEAAGDELALSYQRRYGLSAEEAKQMADEVRANDKFRQNANERA